MPNTLRNYRYMLQATQSPEEKNSSVMSESDQYAMYINKLSTHAAADNKASHDEKKEENFNHAGAIFSLERKVENVNHVSVRFFVALQDRTHHSSRIRHVLLTELEAYASVNLIVEEKSVVNGYFVPVGRAKAYEKLKAVLTQKSGWDEFFTLYNDPVFKEEAGVPTGEDEARYVPSYSLWDVVAHAHTLLAERDIFFRQFADNGLLTQALSQDVLYTLLDQDDLALIYQYSNRAIFLDLLDKHKRLEEWQPLNVGAAQPLDTKFIKTLLSKKYSDLQSVNETRVLFQIPHVIPSDYLRGDQFEEMKELPAPLAYQFTQENMLAAEASLLADYSHLMIRDDKDIGEIKESNGTRFCYVPLALNPVVVDPANPAHPLYQQYQGFKGGLHQLIRGYQPDANTTSVIFCGLMHLNGESYIPYFISKSLDNRIQIAIIEPTLQTHDWDSEEHKRACRKYQAHQMLKNIIQDIFPRCTLTMPVVSQQLRSKDNIPNSLTVISDALLTSEDTQSLVKMVNHNLVLNTNQLSVNLNAMRFIDRQTGQAYFIDYCLRVTASYRSFWMKHLGLVGPEMISTLSKSEIRVTVKDNFFRFKERYEYDPELDIPTEMVQLYLNCTINGLYFEELASQEKRDIIYTLAYAILMPPETKAVPRHYYNPATGFFPHDKSIPMPNASSEDKVAPVARSYQMGQFDNMIRISHLEDVIAMYKRIKTQNTFLDYRDKVRQQFQEEEKLDSAVFKSGIYRSLFQSPSTDIVELDNIVKLVKAINPNEDFLLLQGHVDNISRVIADRWARLRNATTKPQNYIDLSSATDRAYLLMATLLKQAYRNMNVDKSAHQILMPGLVATNIREMNEELEGVYLPSNEIDDFNFKKVALLPDGNWLYGPQLVIDYRDTGVLRDSFTGAVLTKDQVAFIVDHNPQLGLDLSEIMLGRRQFAPVFDAELRDVFLTYIRGSVFASGFRGYYGPIENAWATSAHRTLMNYLTALPPARYDTLMNLQVPDSGQSMGQVFAQGDTCITYAGLRIAGIIWRECPEVTFDQFGSGMAGQEDSFRFRRVPTVNPIDVSAVPTNEQALVEFYFTISDRGAKSIASLRK